MCKFGKMVIVLALLLIPSNIFTQQLRQEIVLSQPPPEGHKYEVISYMDIHTNKQVWRIGIVEVDTISSITDSIGVEGTVGGASVVVLAIRELLVLLIRKKSA